MKRGGSTALGLYTMGIAALFLAGFLLLVIFGAQTYRDAVAVQADNNETRAVLSYLSTCIKSNDRSGNVYVRDDGDGPILTIADGSGYALHIFQSGGRLFEEYSAADKRPSPESAEMLGETDLFDIEVPAENTLRIATDEGSILLHLRSGEDR